MWGEVGDGKTGSMKRREFWFGHAENKMPLNEIQENGMNNHLSIRGVAWAGGISCESSAGTPVGMGTDGLRRAGRRGEKKGADEAP